MTTVRKSSRKLSAGSVRALITIALNFVRERTPESCTRLCAVLCCITGCIVALATEWFAFRHPEHAATTGALVGDTSALIAAGCVALLTRTRIAGDADTSSASDAGGAQ